MHKKRFRTVAALYLAAAVVALGVFAGVNGARARRSERALRYSYEHAFGELVTAVTELDTALEKSVCATSPGLIGSLCTEVFGKAMTAQMSLASLPFSTQELERLSGFISRAGDYAFVLSRTAPAAGGYSAQELENLRGLSEIADTLALNLKGLRSEIQDGSLRLLEAKQAAQTLSDAVPDAAGTLDGGLRLIEQEFPEIPSLIYDGPFSEHLTGAAPRALEGLPTVSEAEARVRAARFLGVGEGRVHLLEACGGELPCYSFSADTAGGATQYLSVTQQGGQVLSLLCSRPVGSAVTDAETAVETARRFLATNGYADMAETYHLTQNGILTVNFAFRQGDVLCYSDLVKVSVALDTGEVCGFEARGYLTAHTVRDLPAQTVGAEEAAAAVPDGLEILARQLALVPSEGKYETLCWEFKCRSSDGRHYIIYADARSGRQHKILILLEDESGVLTL
jgi:germination protein YpeB